MVPLCGGLAIGTLSLGKVIWRHTQEFQRGLHMLEM
jgi:hypothetical protein